MAHAAITSSIVLERTVQANSNPRKATDGPVRKLTTELLKTYKHINEVYYKKKRERQRQREAAKKTYDFQVKIGEVLNGRYEVQKELGKGSFGQVVSAHDRQTDLSVAIKVIKSKDAFRKQAKTEIQLLQLLNSMDPDDQWGIVQLQEVFDHGKHVCLVFEHLSFNLFELLKRMKFTGVSLNLIRKFARQILKTLAFLSLPDIDVVHCDLKPENILVRQPSRSAIKVIDFGSSCKRAKRMYSYIQSRFYRSPEVILGLPYDQAIDMWSLGCILVELHTGVPLFAGRDEMDQMHRFVSLKGLPPRHMLEKGRKTAQFFFVEKQIWDAIPAVPTPPMPPMPARGAGRTSAELFSVPGIPDSAWDVTAPVPEPSAEQDGAGQSSAERFRAIREQSLPSSYSLKPRSERPGASQEQAMVSDLREALGVHTFGPKGRRRDERTGHTERHYELFLDLIERMLEWDPRKRVRPMQALNHPFLREDVEAGREDAAASRTGTPSGSSGPGGAAAAPAAAAADPSDATPAAGHVRSTAAAAAVSAAAAMAASASSGAAAASAAPAGPRSSAAAHLRSGETDSRGYTIL
ncbi:hypothetical protein FNF31_02241 [Cafeteria roenbergensis]|uniref:Protein kinase domain-containing protein n=1 Tax=Cafeteria roenbergensis TaxID=33653 RepID=A0A5A8DGQ6_CAFRO|nr:hypothetical protein FNF31_02241 [Cafeteria roenbergensis]